MPHPITPDLVGLTSDPIAITWSDKDVLLYALAVGCKPETELDFVYEARGPKVLPTFAVIPGLNVMGAVMGQVQFNLAMLLHGEQKIELHRPIPATGKASAIGEIQLDEGLAMFQFTGNSC